VLSGNLRRFSLALPRGVRIPLLRFLAPSLQLVRYRGIHQRRRHVILLLKLGHSPVQFLLVNYLGERGSRDAREAQFCLLGQVFLAKGTSLVVRLPIGQLALREVLTLIH